ncbi:MAG: glycoside hydrolase family 3 protein [Agathobacter sp.]
MASLSYRLDKWLCKKVQKKQMELAQEFTVALGEKHIMEGMPLLARKAAADGIVLLENNGVLPFKKGQKISVFGRCQIDTFYVGYGSGGDVKPPYLVSYLEALKEAEAEGQICLNQSLVQVYEKWTKEPDNEPIQGYWGHWPMSHPEMPVSIAQAQKAAEFSDTAMVILGRAAGEDRENKLEPGSYYLTREEKKLLNSVTKAFKDIVVVMDCGNVVDLSWMDDYKGKISALVYAWQGGMETGHALIDVITGKVNPSGKLTDTIPVTYKEQPSASHFGHKESNDYEEDIYVGYRYFETLMPDKVRYPFGFGLSYTTFRMDVESFTFEKDVKVMVKVTNTGNLPGREVVQLYVSAPQGKLGKAVRSLVAFSKTKELLPGESQKLMLICNEELYASYDDSGVTGYKHAYVLEAGEYSFYVGNSVKNTMCAGTYQLDQTKLLKQLEGVCGVVTDMKRLHVIEKNGSLTYAYENVPKKDYDSGERILSNLPEELVGTVEKKIHFSEVADGTYSLDEFVAQLSEEELEALTRGYGVMDAPQGTSGNAGAFGGIMPLLEERGIPALITSDGPAGVRINAYTSLLPCGTALASTWDLELVEQLYELVGKEMEYHNTHILLGPGMNIHRNPLCGRNFEYFSEDPLLSGKMAAAFVRGIQKNPGRGACPKHFAGNNQEVCRCKNDSRISERALREIYLKGFEIMIKESNPKTIMTSYNKINGVWSHYNYDLATVVLRQEWGYENLVITDWWMQKSHSPEFPELEDDAYRVRAQVDVLMPGNQEKDTKGYVSNGTLLPTLGKEEGITKAELQRTAKNVLKCVRL